MVAVSYLRTRQILFLVLASLVYNSTEIENRAVFSEQMKQTTTVLSVFKICSYPVSNLHNDDTLMSVVNTVTNFNKNCVMRLVLHTNLVILLTSSTYLKYHSFASRIIEKIFPTFI